MAVSKACLLAAGLLVLCLVQSAQAKENVVGAGGSSLVQAQVAAGKSKTIGCGGNKVKVVSANYSGQSSCPRTDALRQVSAGCNGKFFCEVSANEAQVTGKPVAASCGDRLLRVSYTCG